MLYEVLLQGVACGWQKILSAMMWEIEVAVQSNW
jgi:hypothetical protein